MSVRDDSSASWARQLRLPLVLVAAMLVGGALVAGVFLAINGGSVPRAVAPTTLPATAVAVATLAPVVVAPAGGAAAEALPTAHAGVAMGGADTGTLPNPHEGNASAAPVQRIALADAKVRFDAGTLTFIDLRSGQEFAAGHIDTALSITFMDLEERLKALPADTLIVAYGTSAAGASTGAQIFRDIGFTNVAALDGSFADWQTQGFPVAIGNK